MLLFLISIMVIGLVYFLLVGHMQKSRSKKAIGYTLAGILLTFAIMVSFSFNTNLSTEENVKSKNVDVINKEDNHMEEEINSSP